MAGLTSTGFETKRLEDLRADLVTKAKEEFGDSVNTSTNSVLGQLLDIMADRHAELWSIAQALYSTFNADAAEGQQLDNLCALTGVSRLGATKSTVSLEARTTPNTTIPIGSLVGVDNTGVQFRTINDHTSSLSAIRNARVNVVSVTNSTAYTITINGTAYTYTSDGSATLSEIMLGLEALIDPLTAYEFTDNGDGTFTIANVNILEIFSLALSANLSALKITTVIPMESVDTGPQVATAGTLTDILTPVAGWNDSPYEVVIPATNPLEAALGTNEETDSELRDRRKISLQSSGKGTIDAIRAEILGIEGVQAALVTENDTLVTVDGIPAKAFEAVVLHTNTPELEDAVGQAIWDAKPAGIQAFGSTLVNVVDSQGTPQVVYYTKPTEKVVYIRVNYSLYSEESFPSNGVNTIKEKVAESGNELTIGNDVILQRFFGPIYSNVSGISNLDIRIAVTNVGGPVPTYPADYSTSNYAIASDEIARFDVARISTAQV